MDVDIKETYFHYTPLNRTEFKKVNKIYYINKILL